MSTWDDGCEDWTQWCSKLPGCFAGWPASHQLCLLLSAASTGIEKIWLEVQRATRTCWGYVRTFVCACVYVCTANWQVPVCCICPSWPLSCWKIKTSPTTSYLKLNATLSEMGFLIFPFSWFPKSFCSERLLQLSLGSNVNLTFEIMFKWLWGKIPRLLMPQYYMQGCRFYLSTCRRVSSWRIMYTCLIWLWQGSAYRLQLARSLFHSMTCTSIKSLPKVTICNCMWFQLNTK